MKPSSIDIFDPRGGNPGSAAALLAGVLESAMDAIITVDAQQRIVMYNRAAESIFGWSRQDILLQRVEKLIPDSLRAHHAQHVERFEKSGSTSRRLGRGAAVYGLRRNGEAFPLDASVSMLDVAEGKFFTVIIRDVTDRDRLQREQVDSYEKLRESQRKLLMAQRLARIGYWQFDPATNLMWWCDESSNILGVDRRLLDGSYDVFLQVIDPVDRQRFDAERSAAVLSGSQLDTEFRIITSSGEIRWIHMIGSLKCSEHDGKPPHHTGVVREVSQRKRAELDNARSVELLNRTGAMARVGGWEMVIGTGGQYVSKEIYQICELDPSTDVKLEDLAGFYAPEAQPVIRAAMTAAVQNATAWDLDLQLITSKGQRIWVRTQGQAVVLDNKVVRIFGMLQDITGLKAAETALRLSNQELEAFSYSVSHDLRSPLSTINGFSQLLAKNLPANSGEKLHHYLSRIQSGVTHMGQLIEGLLSLSQVSRASLRTEAVDLSLMAQGVLGDWQTRDPGRQVMVQVEVELQIQGDERLIRVLLENLLGNAWKFTSRKAAAEIHVGQILGAAESPVFFVRDNGVGFDMAYVGKLFNPFQRLHTVSEFRGMGIGLATVSRVVRRHGGRLWVEAAVGTGTSFFFTLPASAGGDLSRPGRGDL